MEALGLDIKLLLAQVVNFALLWFILSKFLYKPILKMLDERKKKIKDGLDDAKKIEEKLASIEEKEKEILKAATRKAAVEEKELIALAKGEGSKIVEAARMSAEKESQKALERIRSEEVQMYERLKQRVLKELSESTVKKLEKDAKSDKYPLLSKLLKS